MTPRRITLHCSVTKDGERVEIETIRRWHLERGMRDVGYHLVIQPDGEVQGGRGLNELGAHVEGENRENVGICLPGTTKFTRRAFDSLRRILDSLIQIYEIPRWEIFCHYEFDSAKKQGKTCPNIDIHRLLAWYLAHDERAIQPYLIEESK